MGLLQLCPAYLLDLHGPLTIAISIMPDYHSPTSLEPYFQQTPKVEFGIQSHICQWPSPSFVYDMRVDESETWQYNWLELHCEVCNSDA